MIDPEFWRDRRVLLTGHMGFKGGWLALWLERMGAVVTGFEELIRLMVDADAAALRGTA